MEKLEPNANIHKTLPMNSKKAEKIKKKTQFYNIGVIPLPVKGGGRPDKEVMPVEGG